MRLRIFFVAWLALLPYTVHADPVQRVVDIPTRPGVTQRFLFILPEKPKAAVVLFAGGHGGLQIRDDGRLGWGSGNFLVRSRDAFVGQGIAVAVVDAPSDRQQSPYLKEFRTTPEHVVDIQAVIAWLRKETGRPVWLIGTSRGTQSVGHVATALPGVEGPDGIVLTSSILDDDRSIAVPEMPLQKLDLPVLVVHHTRDGCRVCLYRDMPKLMSKLSGLKRKELVTFTGGRSEGDPCQARAYHGFNGIEPEVVGRIAAWMESEDVRLAMRRSAVSGNVKN